MPISRVLIAFTGLLMVAAPAVADDIAAGREAARQCAVCHGMDGLAKRPDAPNLAGESPIYLQGQLQNYRSGARQHEIMSIIAEDLSDDDIRNVAAYYSAIQVTVTLPE